MGDSMVTGRMSDSKKKAAARILQRQGLNASQAINLMFDKIIKEGSAAFLREEKSREDSELSWSSAAQFVDSLSSERKTRFDGMSKAEIRMDRLRARGLV